MCYGSAVSVRSRDDSRGDLNEIAAAIILKLLGNLMSEARARYGEPTCLDQSSDTVLLLSRPAPAGTPVFAFLAFTSGSHEGAIIHHMRLANAFHERGFKVVVYWMMDRIPSLVARGIPQRVLMRSLRYLPSRPSSLLEGASRIFDIFSQRTRRRFAYNHPGLVSRLLRNFLAEMCEEDSDPALVDRLERLMAADGVTHLLPTFAMSCPLARAARLRGRHRFEFLVTFQGEEIFANYVENGRPLEDYYRQLRRAVDASPWPAATVSADYARRLQEEIGIDLHRMTPLYPGVELPAPGDPP